MDDIARRRHPHDPQGARAFYTRTRRRIYRGSCGEWDGEQAGQKRGRNLDAFCGSRSHRDIRGGGKLVQAGEEPCA